MDEHLAPLVLSDLPRGVDRLALRRVMRSVAGVTRSTDGPTVGPLDYVLVLSHLLCPFGLA